MIPHGLAPYAAIFDSCAREELQYRAAALAGLFTQVVFGFLFLMVLLAFYDASDVVSPLSTSETVAYVWLGQALFAMLPWTVDPRAREAIRTGDVVQELLRPVDTYSVWYARALAWRLIRTSLRFVPMITIAMVGLPLLGLDRYAMPTPSSAPALGLAVVAITLAALLSTALTLLIQVIMIWTVSPDGVLRIVPALTAFFSGGLVPLPLLPEWMQAFLAVQPLRGVLDTPSRIYSGQLEGVQAWMALGWSALWIAVIVAIGHVGIRRGMRRMAVAGG
jgi:ABC-2 type transport system permease protein